MRVKKILWITALLSMILFPEYVFTGLGIILLVVIILLFIVDIALDVYIKILLDRGPYVDTLLRRS